MDDDLVVETHQNVVPYMYEPSAIESLTNQRRESESSTDEESDISDEEYIQDGEKFHWFVYIFLCCSGNLLLDLDIAITGL